MLGFAVDGRGDAVAVGEHHFEEDVIVGVRMRVHYQVRPTPEGCVVSHRLESVLPQGVMGGVLSFFLRARLKRMQRVAVERLVAQSEVLLP
jgi:hypothetical protein